MHQTSSIAPVKTTSPVPLKPASSPLVKTELEHLRDEERQEIDRRKQEEQARVQTLALWD